MCCSSGEVRATLPSNLSTLSRSGAHPSLISASVCVAGIRAKSKYAAANTSAEKVKGAAAGGTASDEEAQNKTQHQRQQNVIQAV
jgi:hypothetical protein